MKRFIFIIITSLYSFNLFASDFVSICDRPITSAILEVSNSLDCQKAYEVAKIIYQKTHRYDSKLNKNFEYLDWRLVVAIIAQESSFKLDAKNCKDGFLMKSKKGIWEKVEVCHDFGPMQINYQTWGDKLNLDINKLTSNWEYAIEVGIYILNYLHSKYAKIEPEHWWTRYHSHTQRFRDEYFERVMKRYTIINGDNIVEKKRR